MNHAIKSGSPQKQRTSCVLVAIHQGSGLSPAAAELDEVSGGRLSALLGRGDLEGKPGQCAMLYELPGVAAERVMLVGCGKAGELTERAYRKALDAAMSALCASGATDALSYLTEVSPGKRGLDWCVRQGVEAAEAAVYQFDRLKSQKAPARHLRRFAQAVPSRKEQAAAERALAEGQAIASGVCLARDLGNLAPNICTPTYLAREARAMARKHKSLSVKVLGEKEMSQLGMGALLAVARGSRQAPQLIALEYRGAPRGRGRGAKAPAPIALVGKGVTFDSGGISIKPSADMDEMKYDMCGAASVLGATLAAAEMGLPIDVVCLVPAVENLPGGNATKPGDVVTTLSGQTVEILNTDAEGRLILCDTLTYAQRYKPAAVVDVATLTGACVIALGKHATGLFSNDQGLADELLAAGRDALDPAWQLPLWDEYQPQLDSNFADMANIGGRDGGAVTAACFLSRYAKAFQWAHLDIAGTAWHSGKAKGGTGRPVPLLVQFLLDRCARAAA